MVPYEDHLMLLQQSEEVALLSFWYVLGSELDLRHLTPECEPDFCLKIAQRWREDIY